MKFPVADIVEEEPRLAAKSFKNVCRSALVEAVVLLDALLEEVLPPEASWIAETRLLKSDFKVSRLLSSVDVVVEEEEVVVVVEEELNWEINPSILLVRLE